MILEACFLLHLGWIKFIEDLRLGFNHGMLLEERYTLFGGFLFNSFPLNVLMKQSKKTLTRRLSLITFALPYLDRTPRGLNKERL